jgi:sulfatase modifying factor 1
MTNCGAGGSGTESCCASLAVQGGTYDRTYDPEGADGGIELGPDGAATALADPATVSSFRLDKYEVTVGRFRQFVAAWANGNGWTPDAGSGRHSYLNGGAGVVNSGSGGGYETGWLSADDSNIAPTDSNLSDAVCDDNGNDATWTSSPLGHENLPINCVNWWESYAFCIWDGGFLPSESEWEYAAAGGDQQREYPWGSEAPGQANAYAIYGNSANDCYYPTGSLTACTGVTSIAPVGLPTLGAGAWGQLDLAGSVWEWNLDWRATYIDPCADCGLLTAASERTVRGGDFYLGPSFLFSSSRGSDAPTHRGNDIGIRCARAPLP